MSKLAEVLDRMLLEHLQLSMRITNLNTASEKYFITDNQQQLLVKQLSHMKDYSDVLQTRINDLKNILASEEYNPNNTVNS